MILNYPDTAQKLVPQINNFIQHWSYQNENKTQFFDDMFTALFNAPCRKSPLILDLLESYVRIQDNLTESRVSFATHLLIDYTTSSPAVTDAPNCLDLIQKLTITHTSTSAILLDRRNEWLIKFYTSVHAVSLCLDINNQIQRLYRKSLIEQKRSWRIFCGLKQTGSRSNYWAKHSCPCSRGQAIKYLHWTCNQYAMP